MLKGDLRCSKSGVILLSGISLGTSPNFQMTGSVILIKWRKLKFHIHFGKLANAAMPSVFGWAQMREQIP